MENLQKDLEEIQQLLTQATRQRVKDALLAEKYKIDAEIVKLQVKETIKNSPTPSAVANRKYHTELQEYGWDQSDKFVKIFITLPGVHDIPEDCVKADFTKTSLIVRIEDLKNKNYSLTIKELHSPIDVIKSYKKVKTDMVAIYMKKAEENQKWSHLTLTEKRLSQLKDMNKDDSNDLKDDPTAGIMNIMKKMYQSGDAETKKLIAKTWIESQEKQKNLEL
ncbi:calcyclin-binding protein [Condylostylus longicornis]|uniref:calcyclin-binding protein n=1 Tax=Condylostylus longicornis TaxID=2530218 RepID=UPI00244E40B9|nr:calcyclin-binding protein [Condylostylus longicornis]